ncbi:MAG: aminopeptidase [Actinobacteria bacterium RBG_16_64_13]|nr:MAG: aminopeptidase [Actinobacteria bacterium RBG_16_64_13]
MKDPRLEMLAANLLDSSLELQRGEKVLIEGEREAVPLMIALVEASYRRGAVPYVRTGDSRLRRAWLLGATREQMDLSAAWEMQRVKDVDASVYILAGENASELADVPGSILEASHLANEPLMDLYLSKKWVLLRFPTASAAQAAGMSTQGFEDFCLDVSSLDYARMDKALDPLVELMSRTDRVRITSPGTDVSFSIKGIPVLKAAGKNNIPDGEVYTAPVRDSVNGTVAYNTPSLEDGVTYERVRFTFKDGRIVDADANEPERLQKLLDTDEGARYLGEFALGLNPRIDRPMKDTLYDEKIGGSLHLTPGRAYEDADNGNRSSIHWDIVLIQTPKWGGGEIYFDDVLVRKDGRFVLPGLEGLNPENLM